MEARALGTQNGQGPPPDSSNPRPGRAAGSGAPGLFSEVCVCDTSAGTVRAVHAFRKGQQVHAVEIDLHGHGGAAGLRRRLGGKCPVIVLLPRSCYLIRELQIPKVLPEEIPAVLSLEVEAAMPPDLGDCEISYRRLENAGEAQQRYEVYVARREALRECLSPMEQLGVVVDFAVPSAVLWRLIFDLAPNAEVLAAAGAPGRQLEAAALMANGSLAVRAIQDSGEADASPNLETGFVEFLRSSLAQSGPDRPSLVVGWIGDRCPTYSMNGRVTFQDMNERLTGPQAGLGNEGADLRLLRVAGLALLGCRDEELLGAGNMLPATVVAERKKKAVYRSAVVGAGACVIGLLLLLAAAQVQIARCQRVVADIDGRMARVGAEGQEVGLRLRQLEAVRAAAATHAVFADILKGLHEASPPEVSFSSVDLREDGEIRLRGQTPSLAVPFLLPAKLEEQPMFEQASLKDAGQVKKVQGSVTEFNMSCRLTRSESP